MYLPQNLYEIKGPLQFIPYFLDLNARTSLFSLADLVEPVVNLPSQSVLSVEKRKGSKTAGVLCGSLKVSVHPGIHLVETVVVGGTEEVVGAERCEKHLLCLHVGSILCYSGPMNLAR